MAYSIKRLIFVFFIFSSASVSQTFEDSSSSQRMIVVKQELVCLAVDGSYFLDANHLGKPIFVKRQFQLSKYRIDDRGRECASAGISNNGFFPDPTPLLIDGQNRTGGISPTNVLSVSRNDISDNWFGPDKVDHLMSSAFLVGLGFFVLKQEAGMSEGTAVNGSVGFSLSAGIAKEVYDWKSQRGVPSLKDLVADLVGLGVGFIMVTIGD